ncbi:MAG TPA: glutamine synthetase [Candidatus Krumholzibacteria bacterium]|nr:glutamine synthetase [Candidatus Krumholzibacteria bacterium]
MAAPQHTNSTAPRPVAYRPAGRLAARLGTPPSEWTVEDLLDLVEADGIRGLSLMHVGGDGWLKALDFVPMSRAHLEDTLLGGERADGSSLFADAGIRAGASDIVLRPRIDTAFLDPFAEQPTLAVLCRHLDRDGAALPVSPDTVVRRAHERVQQECGVDLLALGEVEYFLGRPSDTAETFGSDDRGYHSTTPFVFGAELRRIAMAYLADLGVPVKYGHSEVGWMETDGITWEQHEIELGLAPLPQAADAVVLTQWVLRNLAHQRGWRCSFEPVVRAGHAGSGLHFHFSPVKDGEHLGGGSGAGDFRPEALWLIGGLVRAGGALMAWGNRQPSSFVRLNQGKEAPESITWGRFDRGALVRLPIQARSEDGRFETPPTIEFRLPDGSVHPHLLLAGVAQSMVGARHAADVAELVRASESGTAERAAALPLDRSDVGAQLLEHRDWFAAGGVFDEALLEATLQTLGAEAGDA